MPRGLARRGGGHTSCSAPLAFPETLAEGGSAEVPEPRRLRWSKPPVSPPLSPSRPLQPADASPAPKSGWSVRSASYDNVADADARVVKLKERR